MGRRIQTIDFGSNLLRVQRARYELDQDKKEPRMGIHVYSKQVIVNPPRMESLNHTFRLRVPVLN